MSPPQRMRAPILLPWLLAACAAACAAAYSAPFPRPSAPRASSVRLCEEPPPKPEEPPPLDAADVSTLYASLRKRQQRLGGRRDAAVKERELLAQLAGPKHEEAIANIWEHWFGEEGNRQSGYLKTAGGLVSGRGRGRGRGRGDQQSGHLPTPAVAVAVAVAAAAAVAVPLPLPLPLAPALALALALA